MLKIALSIVLIGFSLNSKADIVEKKGVVVFATASMAAANLRPFETDGCTMYYEGTCEKPYAWEKCCVKHDFAYWHGGAPEDKIAADVELGRCVAASGFPDQGALMVKALNIFAAHSSRWGYGWTQSPGYRKLSDSDVVTYSENSPTEEQFNEITAKLIKMRQSVSPTEKLLCNGVQDQNGG